MEQMLQLLNNKQYKTISEEVKFLSQFPSIMEQEEITAEVMNALEGGDSCVDNCLQACKKKNLKSGNSVEQPDDQA